MSTSKRRDIRRLTMQMLYQADLRAERDMDQVRESLCDGPDDEEVRAAATELARQVMANTAEADALIAELAPDWPTYRQPPVDRAILRLACYEITSGRVPDSVAINEAVELAKRFCTDKSPSFINGVLDRLAKRRRTQARSAESGVESDSDPSSEPAPVNGSA